MTTDIIEYKPTEAAIADIQRFKGLVVDVTTPAGLAAGKEALRQVAAVRIALEKTRKTIKEDVLERGRQIDGQAKPLFARVAEIEDPIKAQIDAEENRIERERQAEIEAEQKRLAEAEAARKRAEEQRIAEDRAKNEAESRRLAEERAKLEAEQKAARDKADAEERERRAAIAAEENAARQRIEEQNRAAIALREQADREAAALRRAEEERLDQERRKVNAEREAEEARQRKVREEAEAKIAAERRAKEEAEREEKRKADELLDADHMLEVFVEKYHHLKRYAPIVLAIKGLLAEKRAKKAA